MKQLINLFKTPRSLAFAIGLGAMLAADVAQAHGWGGSQGNLVQRLERDGRFTTLLAALEVAGLKDTVATGGVFTVLAPTDDAFAALPPGTVESLVTNVPALQNILLYHVLVGRESVIELLHQSTATTLQGNPILALREGFAVRINGQKLDYPSLPASNGIIHPIKGVLIPPATDIVINSIVDVLALDGRFTTLIAAVQAAGLTDALADLLADKEALTAVLLYHVVNGDKSSNELLRRRKVETLQGEDVVVYHWRGSVYVNKSKVIDADLEASNGTIHGLNAVLFPPAK